MPHAIDALETWPAWKEYGGGVDNATDEDFVQAKAAIVAQYGEEAITQSWRKVCARLETVTAELARLQSAAVPVFHYDEMAAAGAAPVLTAAQEALLRKRGCCVVRGVIPRAEAEGLFADLQAFTAANKGRISGWPAESPAIYQLFNAPTQIAIRTHPRHLALQRLLNGLYADASAATSPEPLSYTDAVRIRPAGQAFLGLGPHIDAGSLCRWADEGYRAVYDAVFAGRPEAFDAYDLQARDKADQFRFPARAHSVVFRAFQGWTALTPAAPREGTLMLYPDVCSVVSYVLLRPFFAPPAAREDILDASKWTFDAAGAFFPGTFKDQSQRMSISSHPHLRLRQCLTYIPVMQPGDTVWWHTDLCHAVDPEHTGTGDASVAYVAACPTTQKNKDYIKKQLQAALAGQAPPDRIGVELNEPSLAGYKGYDGVSAEGKRALGFELL